MCFLCAVIKILLNFFIKLLTFKPLFMEKLYTFLVPNHRQKMIASWLIAFLTVFGFSEIKAQCNNDVIPPVAICQDIIVPSYQVK